MQIFDIATKEPASGVLVQLDASLAIKRGNFVNMLADLSPLKMLHAGEGYVMGKETKDGVSTFTVYSILRQKEEAGTILNPGFRFSR
jgi:hypothetical protein